MSRVIIKSFEAVEILRRILNGDEKAWKEGEELIAEIDQSNRHWARLRAEAAAQKQRHQTALQRTRLHNGKFEVVSRSEGGVDHSAPGIILAVKGNARLVWRSGGRYWSSIGSYAYAPAELEIMGEHRIPKKLTDHFQTRGHGKTRRLSKQLILDHRGEIDKVFGVGATERIAKLDKTQNFD